jgi:Xaa-Pro aminopeptidase
MTRDNIAVPKNRLTPSQWKIINQEFPRFSDEEMNRRRNLITNWIKEYDLDHILIYGAYWAGNAVCFFTGWPVTAEAAIVFTLEHKPKMCVQFYNHVPQASLIAYETDVEPGGNSSIQTAILTMKKQGKPNPRVGVIGPIAMGPYRILEENTSEIIDLNRAYGNSRMIKSDEEFEWLKIGAVLSDLSYESVLENIKIGDNERKLGDYVERAYIPFGATNLIHFFGVTNMENPDCCVPRQWPLTRQISKGDIGFTEISSDFWDYSGQILRTFTIGADPNSLYKDLHTTAEATFDAIMAILKPGTTAQDIFDVSSIIEESGFTIYDDLVHGYGGGYLQPILGCKSRPAGPIPNLTLEAGMCMVVQPNIITTDQRAGVQTGEAVRITENGVVSLHDIPRGIHRIDPT